jgi:hypothetical protein
MCNQGECQCGSNCSCGESGGHEGCCGGECNCEHEHGFHRRYQTKAEQKEELEQYQSELKAELQAVEERIADLQK